MTQYRGWTIEQSEPANEAMLAHHQATGQMGRFRDGIERPVDCMGTPINPAEWFHYFSPEGNYVGRFRTVEDCQRRIDFKIDSQSAKHANTKSALTGAVGDTVVVDEQCIGKIAWVSRSRSVVIEQREYYPTIREYATTVNLYGNRGEWIARVPGTDYKELLQYVSDYIEGQIALAEAIEYCDNEEDNA